MVCLPPVEGGNVGVLHPCGSVVLYEACFFSFIFQGSWKNVDLVYNGPICVTASEHWSLRWFSPGLLSRPDLNQGWFRADDADAGFAGVLFNVFIILLTSGNTAAPLEGFFWDPKLDPWLIAFLGCGISSLCKNRFWSILGNQRAKVLLFFEDDGLPF